MRRHWRALSVYSLKWSIYQQLVHLRSFNYSKMLQPVIISRSVIARFRGRCSQLDTLPLIIECIVLWGLSAHKVGPSHATRRGGVCGTHTLRPFSALFIKEFGGGACGFKNESESVLQAQVSRNIGVILREMRALLYQRVRARERDCVCVTARSVCNAHTDGKFPECFVLGLVRWQLPPVWGKAAAWKPGRLKWQLLLIRCQDAAYRCPWRLYERQQKVTRCLWLRLNPRTCSPNNHADRSFRIEVEIIFPSLNFDVNDHVFWKASTVCFLSGCSVWPLSWPLQSFYHDCVVIVCQ